MYPIKEIFNLFQTSFVHINKTTSKSLRNSFSIMDFVLEKKYPRFKRVICPTFFRVSLRNVSGLSTICKPHPISVDHFIFYFVCYDHEQAVKCVFLVLVYFQRELSWFTMLLLCTDSFTFAFAISDSTFMTRCGNK